PVISTSDNIQCILRMGVTSRVPGDCWTPRDAHPSQHASATLHVRQTHGGCPARASRDSDSPYGDRIAVRYRPCGGGDASAASGWVARQGALGDAGWWVSLESGSGRDHSARHKTVGRTGTRVRSVRAGRKTDATPWQRPLTSV